MALPNRFSGNHGPRLRDNKGTFSGWRNAYGSAGVPYSLPRGRGGTDSMVSDYGHTGGPVAPAPIQLPIQFTPPGVTHSKGGTDSMVGEYGDPGVGIVRQPPPATPAASIPSQGRGNGFAAMPQNPARQAMAQQQQPMSVAAPGSPRNSLDSLVNQTRGAAAAQIGGGLQLPLAQPQQYPAQQPLSSNQRYPLPMQMPDGGANALADAINTGSPVPMPSKADPAVWGPGGRQYPAVTPASQGGGQQPLSVAPRYGQPAQQAAMSLQNARQQARDFTSRGVDRIFATNGGPVTTSSPFTGPPNPSSPVAQSMPYGSGSTLIRTADGRTILAGNASAGSLLETARANNGSIPRNSFNRSMQLAMESSANDPRNVKRRGEVADQRAEARDRRIVTNAMRFGVRNPLAIETAQRMGISLPGMPRMSGDAMAAAGGAEPTTAQINASLTAAQKNPVYADIQPGFDPGTAQGSQWASMLQQPNAQKMTPSEVSRVKQELRDAKKSKTYRSNAADAEVTDAFLSGGPQAVSNLIQSRQAAGQPYGVPNFNQGSSNVARGRIGM